MAYFPNGTSGEVFDEQCSKCKYGTKACSIAYVQTSFNYEAANNKIASSILDALVNENGNVQCGNNSGKILKLILTN